MTNPGAPPGDPWARRFALLCLFQAAAWTLIPVLLHPNVSLDVAEIVSWGHEWQFGYYKHPPLIAWICEAAHMIEGAAGRPWAIDLCGQLAVVATLWAVWRLTRRLLAGQEAFLAVLALACTAVCTMRSLEFNHNTLLLTFFALTGWFAFEALRTERGAWHWWLLLGGAIGLGMMTKYQMLFLAICVAAFIFIDPHCRRWLARPQPYAALVLSLAIFSPNLKWLIDHHFVSLTYAQSRMGGTSGDLSHILSPLVFLGDLLLFLLPALLVLVPWLGIPRVRPAATRDERWNRRFVLAVVGGPVSLFLLLGLVTGNSLRGDWGIPLIFAMPTLLLLLFAPRRGPIPGRQAISLGMILIVVQLAFAILQPILAPNRILAPKPLRVQFPGRQLAAEIDQRWHTQFPGTPLPVVAGERWLANNVAFYSKDRPAVLCDQGQHLDSINLDEADCPWTSIAAANQNGAVLIWSATPVPDLPPELRAAFPGARDISALELPQQTWKASSAVKVGIAIVPPQRP